MILLPLKTKYFYVFVKYSLLLLLRPFNTCFQIQFSFHNIYNLHIFDLNNKYNIWRNWILYKHQICPIFKIYWVHILDIFHSAFWFLSNLCLITGQVLKYILIKSSCMNIYLSLNRNILFFYIDCAVNYVFMQDYVFLYTQKYSGVITMRWAREGGFINKKNT